MTKNIEIVVCQQCNKHFELRNLEDRDDYYSLYEEDFCPSCKLEKLALDGIAHFAFLKDAIIVGYSLEDISANPELRYIEIKLTNNTFLKIDVRNTRWVNG